MSEERSHKIVSREKAKEIFREQAAAGDKDAAAILREMEVNDGERRRPPRGDGGEGQLDPFRELRSKRQILNEALHAAIADKRYGVRKTDNARPSLTPKPPEPKGDE